MKRLLLPFLAGLVIGALAISAVRCPDSAAIREWRAKYEGYRAIAEADHAMSMGRIAALEAEKATLQGALDSSATVIAARDTTIATLKGKVTTANAETERLRTEVQPVIDANPALREFVASLDAGIVLRDNLIVEQERQITDLREQGWLKDERFAVQVALTDEWKSAYEREHALRLNCEKGIALYEKQARGLRLGSTIKTVALAAVGGLVIYQAIAK